MNKRQPYDKYWGTTASHYDSKRKTQPKWHREESAFSSLFKMVQPTIVYDCPVGTGRWFHLYKERGSNLLHVIGTDISDDMLKESQKKTCDIPCKVTLQKRDIVRDTSDTVFLGEDGLIVCTRFLNWLPSVDARKVLKTFASMKPKWIILSLNYRHSRLERICRETMKSTAEKIYKAIRKKPFIHDHRREAVLRALRTHGYGLEVEIKVESCRERCSSYFLFSKDPVISKT